MMCMRPEACDDNEFPSCHHSPRNSSGSSTAVTPGFVLPLSLGGSIQKCLWRNGRGSRQRSRSFSSGDGCSINSDLEDKSNGWERNAKMYVYRNQLEKDIERLQQELQEETELHTTLENAIEHKIPHSSGSPRQLPEKAQELLGSISLLETAVGKLERELVILQDQLHHERSERQIAEHNISNSPCKYSPKLNSPPNSIKKIMSPCRDTKQIAESDNTDHSLCHINRPPCKDDSISLSPNHLSEEMISCMRDIFLQFSSSEEYSSAQIISSPTALQRELSNCSSTLLIPESPFMECMENKLRGWENSRDDFSEGSIFNPYKLPGQLEWNRNNGDNGMAIEVSSLSVGKKELLYVAVALKRFRLLVQQLAKVDPSCLTNNEKMAFWINLYNALIMHAYLAYGVPKTDVKLLSLLHKATYTVGGYAFSAAEIEFIVLRMKPPSNRPQLALCMALPEFKEFEEKRNFAIDKPEPLLAFALSCGMYSSPAVRIFTPENVTMLLSQSLQDYVQASVGINNKGKIIVPKLLYTYAKEVVHDLSLPEWISQFLPADQASVIRECASRNKWKLLGARCFTVQPFCSRFRYHFLPDHGLSSPRPSRE
ncbi:hypothetical protein MLD38_006513 [Melastoma candidum]|uniref:Uncharacterized protein n=1 Tax=Melastoma candidum TaxID=119954 RepID=A0ACB9RMS4_9MYRT|nr:hypothetical protein MLD38_006513 [Melastoma candidum]